MEIFSIACSEVIINEHFKSDSCKRSIMHSRIHLSQKLTVLSVPFI